MMAAADWPCAWWLVPAEPQRALLQQWIDRLAIQGPGPSFEPHLTLALSTLPARIVPADLPAQAVAAGVASVCRPDGLSLTADGLGHEPAYFRALYLRLATRRSERMWLADIVRAVAAGLAGAVESTGIQTAATQFVPHLSLAYGAWTAAERQRLAQQVPVCELPDSIRFDTLVGVCPRPGAASLSRVEDWQVSLRLPLVGLDGQGERRLEKTDGL
ncbi:MAG: hypothetical protein Q4B13_07570 [Lautropia sp.]|nr:hypothetical protein [Lautropia sp.]